MGNVPISCCRSKSPRLNRSSSFSSSRGNHNGEYSTPNQHDGGGGYLKGEDASQSIPSHILQHISEREPDDSESDPSSNPFNRPIFATRSSNATKQQQANKANNNNSSNNYSDSNSLNNSTRVSGRQNISQQQHLLLSSSSQDHGYNSTSSTTNLTHLDGLLSNDSFESNIHRSSKANNCFNANKSDKTDKFYSPSDANVYKHLSKQLHDTNYNEHTKNYIPRSSSCSTIYIDGSTVSQPDLKQTIKCVSLAIYYHIRNRTSDCSAEIFDESVYPLKMPDEPKDNNEQQHDQLTALDNSSGDFGDDEDDEDQLDEVQINDRVAYKTDKRTIYKFVKTLFKAARLTSEYAITTLVYLERLMTYSEMDLAPKTWRRMFLGAILLSSKVWEDQAVWNVDYAQILDDISVEDINELERQFLELIQFNMNVPSSVYAKYYFHLRTLALKNGLNKQQALLTIGDAKNLEAMNRVQLNDWQSSPIHRKMSPPLKRYTSLERSRLNGLTKAVLM